MPKRLIAMKRFALYLFLVFVLIGSVHANVKSGLNGKRNGGANSTESVLGYTWSKHALQGYSMKIWLSNQMAMGQEAWDPDNVPQGDCSTGIGLEYPSGSCVEHLFGAAPWIGGLINGKRYV